MIETVSPHIHMRFQRVLDYIEVHLDADLTVEHLSTIAHYSKFHFHRQFTALFGVGVVKYVQLKRLKRATHQLAFRKQIPITTIAFDCGYESPEAFARAFKTTLGQTPSAFRNDPDWNSWQDIYKLVTQMRTLKMTDEKTHTIKVIDFPATRIAVLEHRGAPHLVMNTVGRFIEWRKANHLPPKFSATYNILYDDPATTPAKAYRFDICAATDKEILPNDIGVIAKIIPEGRCAVIRYIGVDTGVEAVVRYLYEAWLPDSGEEVRDFPVFLQRVKFFPDVAEHEAVVDIFLPLN